MSTIEVARAIYAYHGEEGLNFNAGQTINVKEKGANGWWKGDLESNGIMIEGWFPANFVQIDDTSPQVSTYLYLLHLPR